MSFLGLGLSLNNWISLAVIFIPISFTFLYRIGVEEKLLIHKFGIAYTVYKKTTKRLIPGIY
jgi:protein-S-isoprenylcysteine O-methyltransferase Ste14